MKLIIDIDEEKYKWLKENNPNADINSIVGAVVNGTPVKTVTNAEEAEAYPINQEDICEPTTQGNCEWYTSDIRWTDKLSVTENGDIIDFDGRVVGHIDLELYMSCGKETENEQTTD